MTKLNWFFILQGIVFLFSFLFVTFTLPLLEKLGCRQVVRDDGPQAHLVKANTPTMGGLYGLVFFTIYMLITYALSPKVFNSGSLFALYSLFLAYGILGMIDDLCKINAKKGLSISFKLLLQIFVSLLWSYCFVSHHDIVIPGLLTIKLSGVWPMLWTSFVIVASVNAINFTDGLDGLMIQTVLMVLLGLLVIAYAMDYSSGLVYAGLFTCLILLMIYPFNLYPAKLFLGDTGSMSIGAIVAGLALLQQLEIPFILMGIIFVIETMSVAIQIMSFKLFRKRVFKMAPIHHGFELSGWHEKEVVRLFTIITLIGTFLAVWWVIG